MSCKVNCLLTGHLVHWSVHKIHLSKDPTTYQFIHLSTYLFVRDVNQLVSKVEYKPSYSFAQKNLTPSSSQCDSFSELYSRITTQSLWPPFDRTIVLLNICRQIWSVQLSRILQRHGKTILSCILVKKFFTLISTTTTPGWQKVWLLFMFLMTAKERPTWQSTPV